MITQSYSEQEQYISNVEANLVPPQITPSGSVAREKAKYTLDPNDPENLDVQSNGQYKFDSQHVKSGRRELGWTEQTYVGVATAGGAVRNTILSGSYGELKKLRVDSEVNSETITTSWSASISENLRVGRNAGVAGYVNIGNTGSLVTSSQKGVSPQPNFAPNSENISNVRLIVSDSAIIQTDFYVKNNTSVSGALVVSGSTNLNNLYVSGNAVVSESVNIGKNLGVTGSTTLKGALVVNGNTVLKKNLTVSGSSSVVGDFQVQGTSSLRDVHILGNLQVDGTASYLNVDDLYVKDKTITLASGSTVPGQVDGAGIHIEGANVDFLYDSQTDKMTLNKDFDVDGTASANNISADENITAGNTVSSVTGSFEYLNVSSSASINNLNVTENATVDGIMSASYFYGDGTHIRNLTASVASSSTWKSYLDFEAGATQRVSHPFNTTDVFVQVYEWDDPNFHPNLASGSSFSGSATRVNDAVVKIVDNEFVDISNATAVNGYAVISDAGMIITASVDLLQVAADYAEFTIPVGNEKTIYRFEHKLGTKNLIVNVYQYADVKDGYGTVMPVQILPEQIAIPDNSHIDVVFGRGGINGYIVIGKAGHVIRESTIDDYIDTLNIHYGTTGSWQADRFTAVSLSADVIYAGEYVDAHIVGNRDSGPQQYTSCSWGSYTEYTDAGINEWVRYSATESDIRQVSNIDKNGNLTIRGNLTTNGSFSTSDIRKKNIIGNVENALEGIEKINGVRFNWKDSGEPSIGVIAQEINAIYPELTKIVPDLDNKDQMVVNYEGVIGVLIEAVKELSSKVKNLENKLENENR